MNETKPITTLKELVEIIGKQLRFYHPIYYELDRLNRIEAAAEQLLYEMNNNGLVQTAAKDLQDALDIKKQRYAP